MKYREFWLDDKYPDVWKEYVEGAIHVIEHQAYTDLKAECEAMSEALESLDQPLCERIIDPCGYNPKDEPKESLIDSVLALSDENEKSLNVVRKAQARYAAYKKGLDG